MFYLAQIFGFTSLIILIISFQKNSKKTLLKYQIVSSSFEAIQYLLLSALSGCVMNITMCIRNLIFFKYKEKIPNIYLIFIIIVMTILSLISYNGAISLLPCIGSIIYTIALAKSNITITRITNTITCILYLIYDIKVLAIAGMISTITELISTIIAIIRYDLKKN